MRDYIDIVKGLEALLDDNDKCISKMCNACSYLFYEIDNINWIGFYFVGDKDLYLGPFMGKPACTRLPFDKGVCAKAYRTKKTVVVSNVDNFDGHIACDSESKSEIVIPIFKDDELLALLDIDSNVERRFNEKDVEGLHNILRVLESKIFDDCY